MSRCPCLLAVAVLWSIPACGDPAAVPEPASKTAAFTTISGPFAHDNLQIWLVHGQDASGPARATLPLAAALQQGLAVVHETGDVNELAIENVGKDFDVYVQSGDIVQGGKQDRTIGVDLVLAPASGCVPLPSFCVERGRWAARGPAGREVSEATYAGLGANAPVGVGGAGCSSGFLSSENNVSMNELRKAVLLQKDQESVWSEVASAQGALFANAGGAVIDSNSPTSLELTLNAGPVQAAIGDYTAALQAIVAPHRDAVGCVVAIGGKLDCADVYGSHALFEQLWPKLLRAAATAAVARLQEKHDGPALRSEQVHAFVAGSCVHAETRDIPGGVRMAIGANPVAHVIESSSGGKVLHRAWLAK